MYCGKSSSRRVVVGAWVLVGVTGSAGCGLLGVFGEFNASRGEGEGDPAPRVDVSVVQLRQEGEAVVEEPVGANLHRPVAVGRMRRRAAVLSAELDDGQATGAALLFEAPLDVPAGPVTRLEGVTPSAFSLFADIDDDGDEDLLVVGEGAPVLLLDDGGAFLVLSAGELVAQGRGALFDVDEDGDREVILPGGGFGKSQLVDVEDGQVTVRLIGQQEVFDGTNHCAADWRVANDTLFQRTSRCTAERPGDPFVADRIAVAGVGGATVVSVASGVDATVLVQPARGFGDGDLVLVGRDPAGALETVVVAPSLELLTLPERALGVADLDGDGAVTLITTALVPEGGVVFVVEGDGVADLALIVRATAR